MGEGEGQVRKFNLEIKLDEGVMKTPCDVANVLRRLSNITLNSSEVPLSGEILNANGNRVGFWEFVDVFEFSSKEK